MIENFLLWCLLLNLAIYALTAIAALIMRGFMVNMHQKIFGMDEAAVLSSVQQYLANYKLLVTVFVFVPWLVLLLMP